LYMYPRIFVKLFKIFVFILSISAVFSFAQNTPVQNIQNSDWVAQDGLGRSLPQYSETGGVKDRWVGVFYWLWHGSVRTNVIYDVTKEMSQNPFNPQWIWADWWWGEPENGYYHSGDAWVARKNLTMLANAGVDFLFFDYTNGAIGHPYLNNFLDVAMELKSQGIAVPKFVFFLNANAKTTMQLVYDDIYSQNKYQELWFYWDGKPLMMEHVDSANTQAMRDFFTFRDSWAFQQETTDQWRFIDNYPQRASYHNGQVEQMVVNKGMGAPMVIKGQVNDKGSSFSKQRYDADGTLPVYNEYWVSDSTPYGIYFQEHWDRALSVDAPLTLVTGWNEWTAGAWNMDVGSAANYNFLDKPMDQDPGHWFFVDQFNEEFNRDIEPMKGGYGDAYYYQMVANIRMYKGMPAPTEASDPKTIQIDGLVADWNGVMPEYFDPQKDTDHRDYKNCSQDGGRYTNTTGRNDIIEARVTHDATMLYFYVKTQANLTPSSDPQWMELWIDADQNAGTGWEGFEFQVEGLISGGKRSLKRWNGSSWVVVNADVFAKAQGQQMELSIAKSTLGLGAQPSFDFKWSDNVGSEGNVMSFVDHGDAAPDRRFNYRYTGLAVSETRGVYPGPDAPILPGEIELENFDRGGEGVAFHDSDPTNNGGQYRNTGVDIQAIPAGGYSLGWVNPGEWLEYTVNVAESGDYVVEVMGSSVLGKDSLEVSAILNGSKVSVGFEATGGLHNYVSQSSLISLQPGIQVIRVTITKSAGGFNLDKIQFLKYDPPVAIPLRPAHKQQFNPSLLNIDGLGRRVHGKNQNIVIYNK
jgi:hypothetical protein